MDIDVITPPFQHTEGPVWIEENQSLYFVDTFKPTVLRWDSISKKVISHQLDGDSVGFIVPVKEMTDTYVLCKDRDICIFNWNGKSGNTGSFQHLFHVDKDKHFNQFNDGKADASGRLWAGTLTRNKDYTVAREGGSLYSIEASSEMNVENKISPVSISNGIAWSGDKKTFFYIDSVTRKIMKYKFDLTKGVIDQPEVLFDMDSHPNLKGIPDGMTIDSDDNLWVALYEGKAVIQVNSKTGQLLVVKTMPVTYVTSVAFGGPDYNVLYVTTSKLKLSAKKLLDEPTAGSVFAIYNLGVRGYPPDKFIFNSKIQ